MSTFLVVGRRRVLAERIRQKPNAIRVRDDTQYACMAQADTEYLALIQDSAVYSYVLDSYPLQDAQGVFGGKSRVRMALSGNLGAMCTVLSVLPFLLRLLDSLCL